jgi:retinol dehydrogenase-12
MFPPKDWLTTDGYDLQFGTNVLGMTIASLPQNSNLSAGHFYFTKLLLPTLIATAKSAPDGKARVITTSSSAHFFKGLTFSTFKDSPARKKLSTTDLYGQSKTAS